MASSTKQAAAAVTPISYMGRKAVLLANEQVRVVVDELGGMVPEFGLRRGKGVLNAHWVPGFRDTSGQPWAVARHEAYWKAKLLFHIAGDFPCSPSFGAPCTVDGVEHPVHGWAANEAWTPEGMGVDEATGAAWARASLRSPAPALPLAWRKVDLVLPGQPVHFSVLRVENAGAAAVAVNVAHHNTLGAPFLQAGCRISCAADRFMVVPMGSEFDETGRLVPGAEHVGCHRVAEKEYESRVLAFFEANLGAPRR